MAGGSARDLRRRIRSVRNTAQLTRAMKMVAAAKLRRTQEAMLGARPAAEALRVVLGGVARRARPELHPLLAARPERSVEYIILTGDKGLAGSFNANVLRHADHILAERREAGQTARVVLIGRRGSDYYRRRPKVEVIERHSDVFRQVTYAFAREVAGRIEQRYIAGETDAVYLVYNQFRSMISQKLVIEPLLPLSLLATADGATDDRSQVDYLYEPEPEALLAEILPRFVSFQVYHALLESAAAEHAARMTAMEAATKNANELIGKLTLQMNRARQASITTEIIEVVSGAEALAH
ncbi:MAG: ATP synthase F1 subunit gamma [Acidobacteria bacterium]|nr:ATP synthase F1 subunit gamma [Acidobacteriota bacterium]